MTGTHSPRPTDLVALISFDGEVYENQAVTREGLGKRPAAPHALAATIEGWLRRGRQVWIDVRGRQIHGIAAARPLSSPDAWMIDTLVDAGEPHERVVEALLAQASESAIQAGVSRLLLRVRADTPALSQAMRAGFVRAMHEELWVREDSSQATPSSPPAAGGLVREAEEADQFALFQLYNRALPIDARQALAVTFEEWQAAQERRWLTRGGRELVAYDGGRIRAWLQVSPHGQLTLLVEPGHEGTAEALHGAAAARLEGVERALALQPVCAGTPSALLRANGYQAEGEYVLLARRTARLLAEPVAHAAGRTVPTRG
jgi:hypothetical protein